MQIDKAQLEQLQNSGKFEKALQIVTDFEKNKDLTSQDRLTCQLLKTNLLIKIGDFESALQIAEDTLELSKKLEAPLLEIDVLIAQAEVLWRLGLLDKGLSTIATGEQLLESLTGISPTEESWRKAALTYHAGTIHFYKGDLDHALDHYKQSLQIFEEVGKEQDIAENLGSIGAIYYRKGKLDLALDFLEQSWLIFEITGNKQEIAKTLANIGVIQVTKGELDRGLEYYQRSLLINEKIENRQATAAVIRNIGRTYHQKGDFDQALKYLDHSLELFENIGNNLDTSRTLLYLISVTTDRQTEPDIQARRYLRRLQEINKHEDNKVINQQYRVAKAMLLKTGARAISLAKAEETLEQVIQEKVIDHEVTIFAMLHLCDLYLYELKTTGNEEILNDVRKLIEQLKIIAKQQHSYSLLAEIFLLQSKLLLLELQVKEALQLMTRAQLLTEEKGLIRLQQIITSEYSSIIVQLDKWEKFRDHKLPLKELVELTNLDVLLDRLIYKRLYQKEEELLDYAKKAHEMVKTLEDDNE
ncbi:MAG: tetratricopeptide repeat protein [Candidatus Odinarchaeota archaeon]